ncbi:ABC transporter permease [Paenibacillus sp. YPG26]|uniref:ABC transporter permease n=1 Tax=Paenibacillus sp. YPG26 TaxID=2878915 RepID=UPI00203BAE47|nr:ABC transporter permease [Paenibacillus sp. YPG26]USB33159.1 ABC transporter permease [Paenibacillus sp. YPG26]
MNTLIKNELMKLKRLKSMYLVLILSFLPYIINTIGLLLMRGSRDAGNYYFFVFNQYAILFPTLIFIFTGYAFYMEFKNRTLMQWMSYPHSNFRLILSKMISTFILLMAFSLLNQLALFVTLWTAYAESVTIIQLASWFAGSFSFAFLSLFSIPIAAVLAFITRNIVGVILTGVASIFITTILLGLNLSITYPFSYIYRVTIRLYDSSFGYPGIQWYLWGAVILLGYTGISSLLLYITVRNPRLS